MSHRNRKLPWTSVKGSRRFMRRPWKWAEDPAPHRVKLARQVEAEPLDLPAAVPVQEPPIERSER